MTISGTGTQYACSCAWVDITPDHPVVLAGNGRPNQPWEAVDSRLEANAILLADEKARILIISADLLYFGAELVSALEQRAAVHGIPPEHVVFSASHTHFAPAAERSKPLLGAADEAYLDFLLGQLLKLIDTVSLAPTRPVFVRMSRQKTDLNIYRRRRWPFPTLSRKGLRLKPTMVLAPTRNAAWDEYIDVLQFVGPDDDLICAAWKFACHPVSFYEPSSVSAEYPGRARERLRQVAGKPVPLVFWQGFTGDVRPNLLGKISWKNRLMTALVGPTCGRVDKEEWTEWAGRISECLVSAVKGGDFRQISGVLRISNASIPLTRLVPEESNPHLRERSLGLRCLSFGTDTSVVFVGAEVCSPYWKAFSGGERMICVGYTGEVFGYLPSEQQVREGGYEAEKFLHSFGLAGSFRKGFESEILAAFDRLVSGRRSERDKIALSNSSPPYNAEPTRLGNGAS